MSVSERESRSGERLREQIGTFRSWLELARQSHPHLYEFLGVCARLSQRAVNVKQREGFSYVETDISGVALTEIDWLTQDALGKKP